MYGLRTALRGSWNVSTGRGEAVITEIGGKLFFGAIVRYYVLNPAIRLIVFRNIRVGAANREPRYAQNRKRHDHGRPFVPVEEDVVSREIRCKMRNLVEDVGESIGRSRAEIGAERCADSSLDAFHRLVFRKLCLGVEAPLVYQHVVRGDNGGREGVDDSGGKLLASAIEA